MKKLKIGFLVSTALLFYSISFAQPYTLDEDITPTKLELKDDKKRKGAKSVLANATIENDPQYYYVNGCSMFQFIDVFIFSNFGSPNFKVELAKNTWNEVEESATTRGSDDGIINFKLRTEGDFGFKIIPTGEKINYSIVVYASSPIQEQLGSVFKKAKANDYENDSGGSLTEGDSSTNSGGGSNIILYIILGVALLVIGFLAAKLSSKNKAGIIVILLSLTFSFQSIAQGELRIFDPGELENSSYEDWLEQEAPQLAEDGVEALDRGLDRIGIVGDIISDDKRYTRVRELYDSYVGLGDCMSAGPPPGMPRIPSFCETDECGSCFQRARADFNTTRYSLERLKTIYSCTKTFTDKAISFGDNVSGIHGVSGLAWQAERTQIMKSIKSLKKSYDAKYVELLASQKRALMKLNDCEAEHGIPDWYDRFGYMYYEFSAMNYKRND